MSVESQADITKLRVFMMLINLLLATEMKRYSSALLCLRPVLVLMSSRASLEEAKMFQAFYFLLFRQEVGDCDFALFVHV